MEVEGKLRAYAGQVDARLDALLPTESARPPELARAMRYACLAPGKRLRPALCLASCEAAGGDPNVALDAACSLELVHCFSLIHDDLPALDNDDLRRGRPTLHKAFGEAIAILAGDALFALAFQVLTTATHGLECLRILSGAVGLCGLVAGEAADILAEGQEVTLEDIRFIHSHKTGALISAACEMGATVGSTQPDHARALATYGSGLGLAFQIADDLLNETATPEELGKSAGSDREHRKATYPSLVGLEESRQEAKHLVEQALAQLEGLPGPTDFLESLARFAVERRR